VQPVAHQSTSPRKCVQQEWSSTGKSADAVGSTLQTAAVEDPLLLPEREVHAENGVHWFLDREIPKGGYVRILAHIYMDLSYIDPQSRVRNYCCT